MSEIDPRGPRTAAVLTTLVLAVVLLTGSPELLCLQALVFALGVTGRSPYVLVYRRLVRPRLGPPAALEPEAPVRFAQLVGLAAATVGTVALVAGARTLATSAVSAALAASFLDAAFGLCLGCELFLLVRRPSPGTAAARRSHPSHPSTHHREGATA